MKLLTKKKKVKTTEKKVMPKPPHTIRKLNKSYWGFSVWLVSLACWFRGFLPPLDNYIHKHCIVCPLERVHQHEGSVQEKHWQILVFYWFYRQKCLITNNLWTEVTKCQTLSSYWWLTGCLCKKTNHKCYEEILLPVNITMSNAISGGTDMGYLPVSRFFFGMGQGYCWLLT